MVERIYESKVNRIDRAEGSLDKREAEKHISGYRHRGRGKGGKLNYQLCEKTGRERWLDV